MLRHMSYPHRDMFVLWSIVATVWTGIMVWFKVFAVCPVSWWVVMAPVASVFVWLVISFLFIFSVVLLLSEK